ncbi:DUF748 domain-containing protein [Polynucleobacter sp. UK-Kesae-W10]|uniref:DUF748 domain-containing protein n=1 Tax=Polynucleobacter sp. UK-Kesae-W10 TaxID=1819738 RepID=UPI001C0BAC46|nr:DUF748 domain-containing protein [Polynucleobacter sp. UK-Kesae-W10]MBU3577874.1 DUF748 domain-containing protein [Polynucleobacter sp. UK-Kesae-W10]
MFSLKNPRIPVWSLRIAAALVTLTILFWGGCHLFVPGFLKKSAAEFGEKIGYDIAYRDVSLSPLRLRLEIDGLHLAKEGGNKLLDFKKLIITLKWSKLVLGEIGFDEIILEEPKLLVERRATKSHSAQAVWNWQEFIHAVEKSLPPKDPNTSKKPQKISIDEFLVTDGALALVDESSKLKEELKPFSIKLLEVANYDQNGVVSGVRGQYDFNLGSLQLLIPGLNKSVAFAHVAISGGLDNPSPNQLGAQLDLQLDDGSIRSHWDLNTASKAIEGKITLANIATAPLIALLPANKELLGTSGSLNADLLLKLGNDGEVLSGNAQLAHLAVLEKGEKTPLIMWDAADIHQFEYKSSKTPRAKATTLAIDEVVVDHPVLRFEINNQGLSNFRRLFSKPQAEEKAVDAPVATGAKSKAADGVGLDIRSVNLKGGEVFFTDLAMRPNFKVDVKKFNATFLGVSNIPGRFATVAMDGVVANSGSLRAKGQASFDDPRRNHDILMSFKNLPLSTFNPAVMTYAGYQITGGNLNLNLTYRAKDGQLNGSNQIIIKNVQLGDEVPDFQGKKLPLGLAIALLEDSDDTIDVTIRIAGNVDSPQFSASGLVWQAISNVLTNVATAPFRALASILGMGGDEGVNAVPGEAVFLPADQDRLEQFGEYLVKRPNSSMEIIGTYDPVQDKQEMARAKADGAILKDAGFKIEAGEPIPIPSFSDPRVQSGLKTAYAQYIGRIKLGQRLLMLPDGEARNEQLHSELIAGIEVTNAELQSLAKNRAQAAYAFMVKENPGLKDRITIGDVKAVEAGKEGIPLDVELRIK